MKRRSGTTSPQRGLRIPARLAASLAAWLLLLVVGGAGAQAAERYYYLQEGRRVYLTPAPDLLSVGLKPGRELPAPGALELPSGRIEALSEAVTPAVRRVSLAGPLGGAPEKPVLRESLRLTPGPKPPARSPPPTTPQAPLEPGLRSALLGEALQSYRAAPEVAWAYEALVPEGGASALLPTPQLVVRVQAGIDEAALRRLLPASLRVLRRMPGTEREYLLALASPGQDHPVTLAALLAEHYPEIEWAEPDFIREWSLNAVPDNTLFGDQWHLEHTASHAGPVGADANLPSAWDTTAGDGSVVIAVVDDGVQLAHPDLSGQIFVNTAEQDGTPGEDDDGNGYVDDVNGWDFCHNDNDPSPLWNGTNGTGGHGTAVAGVAAGAGNNGKGISGACQDCAILPVRIFCDSGGAASYSQIAAAIRYAGALADVLNNSWGAPSSEPQSSTLNSALADVYNAGAGKPLLFAAGNSASGYIPFSLTGFINPGNYIFEWVYRKDDSTSKGFDTVWLDNVVFPGGAVEDFEACDGPTLNAADGWDSFGDAPWSVVNDETRASATGGGNCAAQSGPIGNGQQTALRVTRAVGSGDLHYEAWVSSESTGSGYLSQSCYDVFELYVTLQGGSRTGPYLPLCGWYSNQNTPLEDGTLGYPANRAETIAVGAVTNYDRRSDYGQGGPGLDVAAHSSGGSLGIVTTDLAGTQGYNANTSGAGGDYTDTFGGTSSATPLVSGIVGLMLSNTPAMTESQVRTALHNAGRQIGCTPYAAGFNAVYGYGVVDADAAVTSNPPGGQLDTCSSGAQGAFPLDPNTRVPNPSSSKDSDVVTVSTAGGGSGCLISWLTRGLLADARLDPLRRVRDAIWRQGAWGRALVRSYYRASRPIIAWLEGGR
jgi:subtilisin family serine protease